MELCIKALGLPFVVAGDFNMLQDELEIKAMTANNENLKMQRQLESLNRKLEEMDRENNEIETENKKMQKTSETLKVSARRVNLLEAENLTSRSCRLSRILLTACPPLAFGHGMSPL